VTTSLQLDESEQDISSHSSNHGNAAPQWPEVRDVGYGVKGRPRN